MVGEGGRRRVVVRMERAVRVDRMGCCLVGLSWCSLLLDDMCEIIGELLGVLVVIVCGWMVLKAAAGDVVIITAVRSNLLAVMVLLYVC